MSLKEIEFEYSDDPRAADSWQVPGTAFADWAESSQVEVVVLNDDALSAVVRLNYWDAIRHVKLSRRRALRLGWESASGSSSGSDDDDPGHVDIRELFRSLCDRWKEETLVESSLTQIVTHGAYQRIIGLGPAVLPLIFDELEREPAQWFWALSAITGEDPAVGEDTVRGASVKWLEWAAEHGFRTGAEAA